MPAGRVTLIIFTVSTYPASRLSKVMLMPDSRSRSFGPKWSLGTVADSFCGKIVYRPRAFASTARSIRGKTASGAKASTSARTAL